jgi:hypothetical protein
MLCVNSAFGQTVADVETKYGKPTPAYSVSEHIWMTPEYTVDRQVCRMRLYPKRIAAETNYLSRKLPFKELQEVLNVLVPIDKRGAKKEGFGSTATGGPAAWATFAYENVTFTLVSSFPSLGYDDSPPLKKGDFVFSTENVKGAERPESALPSNDDFQYGETSKSDIVTVTWNGRKCTQQRGE